MKKYNRLKISKWAVVFVAASIIALALMVVPGILPIRIEKSTLNREANHLKAMIEQQQILHPLYAGIKKKMDEKSGLETIIERSKQYEGPLEIDNAPDLLGSMARSAGLSEVRFTPVPESVTKASDRLLVEGGFKGAYQSFREFLLNLSCSENFNHLELLEIQSKEKGKEYTIRIWMSIG
jgi:hypothetical protein